MKGSYTLFIPQRKEYSRCSFVLKIESVSVTVAIYVIHADTFIFLILLQEWHIVGHYSACSDIALSICHVGFLTSLLVS